MCGVLSCNISSHWASFVTEGMMSNNNTGLVVTHTVYDLHAFYPNKFPTPIPGPSPLNPVSFTDVSDDVV